MNENNIDKSSFTQYNSQLYKLRLNKKQLVLLLIVIGTCFASFIICVIYGGYMESGYELVVAFPMVYLLFLPFAFDATLKSRLKITSVLYLVIQWGRFVLLPFIIALSKGHASSYLRVSSENLNIACWLMIYEFVVCTIFIIVYQRRLINKISPESSHEIGGLKIVYIVFIIIAFVVFAIYYFVYGLKLLNFLFIEVDTGARTGDIVDTGLVLVRQIVLLAIMFLFLLVTEWAEKKRESSNKNYYFYIALIVALFSICLIVGERRSAQIYAAFCCSIVLIRAFPNQRKKIIRLIAIVAGIVLLFLSIYKFSYAFMYSSYSEALRNSDFSTGSIAKILQAYFAGPENVGKAIEFSQHTDIGVFHWSYDALRSTVPISFIMKGKGELTSVLFNNYIYGGLQNNGHVLSSLGYGYIYFTPVFCPIVMLVNLLISFFFEKKMLQCKSYEMLYIYAYVMLRFALNISANTPALISASTIMLFTGGLVVILAHGLKKRR